MIKNEPTTEQELLQILNGVAETTEQEKTIIDFSFTNFLKSAKMSDDIKMMFGNYIHSNELCILFGKTGVGKSVLAYTIADGLSRGQSILEQPNECEPQRVLYYDFEMEKPHIKKRFFGYEPNENFLRPDISKIMQITDGRFDFRVIEEHIIATSPNVIIIDNISAVSLKSLQDQDSALLLMKDAKLIKDKYNLTIIMLAHTPKLRENRPIDKYDVSGSGHLLNFVDSMVAIGKSEQDVNLRYIKSVKNRNSCETDEVLVCEIDNNDWLHFGFVGMEKEANHLQQDPDRAEKKKQSLIDIARTIIGNKSIRYGDFCESYANSYSKSIVNGKRVISQLINSNIITKTPDGKYIVNGNEMEF